MPRLSLSSLVSDRSSYAKMESPKGAGNSEAQAVARLEGQKQAVRAEWQKASVAFGKLDPAKITETQKTEFEDFKNKSINKIARINASIKSLTVSEVPGQII